MKKTELEKLRIENKALVKLNGILFNENASLKKKQNHNVEILVQLFEAGGFNIPDLLLKIGRFKSLKYENGRTEIEIT